MIREHLSPMRAALALGLMGLGAAVRVACFTLAGEEGRPPPSIEASWRASSPQPSTHHPMLVPSHRRTR